MLSDVLKQIFIYEVSHAFETAYDQNNASFYTIL